MYTPRVADAADAQPERVSPWRSPWLLVAGLVFALSAAQIYAGVWRRGAAQFIPSVAAAPHRYQGVVAADHGFVVWQVSRNARALTLDPLHFYEAEHCYPARHSLAYGGAVIAMAVLAIPFYWASGDPVWTYNAVLVVKVLLAAAAMFALVREWTASPAAGIIAGVLYAFHPLELQNPVHPHIFDTTWSVLALWFGRRLFARGRWLDAVGLGASLAMQLAASFYPFVAAVLLGLPLAVWLLAHHGLRGVRPARLALALTIAAAGALFVFAPYLELRAAGALPVRRLQHFTHAPSWRPGGEFFPGWVCLGLASAGLVAPRRRALAGIPGDPRAALVAGALLVAWAAAGPAANLAGRGTSLWRALSALLPGLDAVRTPGVIAVGAHVPLCVLAGAGAAAAFGLARGRALTAAAALAVAAVFADTLRPAWLGLEPRIDYAAFRIAPNPENIAFYRALAQKGSVGPIFELPIPRLGGLPAWDFSWPWVLLSAYHHRPTSACISAALPERRRLEELEQELPAREAVADLVRIGFTTIVFHHRARARSQPEGPPAPEDPDTAGQRLRALDAAAATPGSGLHLLFATEAQSAYELTPAAEVLAPPGGR